MSFQARFRTFHQCINLGRFDESAVLTRFLARPDEVIE